MLLGAVLEALAELGVVGDVDADGLLAADLRPDPVLVGGHVAGIDLDADIDGCAVGLAGGAFFSDRALNGQTAMELAPAAGQRYRSKPSAFAFSARRIR